jgi:hypothetical protein
MALDIKSLLGKVTSQLTDTVSEKAKASAISTLKDPEFKATVNQFTRDWIDEHKYILAAVFGTFLLLTIMATINIVTDFSSRK